MYNQQQIKQAVESKGYKWFDGGNFDVNIVAVRTYDNKVRNKFDDFITLSYKEDGVWKFHCWPATTDPGSYYMKKLLSNEGCARLAPGQYRGSHQIGLHQGKYEALRQVKPMTVFRDNNKDDIYDEKKTQTGVFGINVHKAGADSLNVDSWSAGCQVFKCIKDFEMFMKICNKAKLIWGNSFTLTLITSQDVK